MRMSSEMFDSGYAGWLMRSYGDYPGSDLGGSYTVLFHVMHDVQFHAVLEADQAMESYGRHLRVRYAESLGCDIDGADLSYPASFLETVCAMATMMEDRLMYDPSKETGAYIWFWEMLDNAWLSHCNDQWFEEGHNLSGYVQKRIDDIILRRYDSFGNGSLFYTQHHDIGLDYPNMSLWEQMNYYAMHHPV